MSEITNQDQADKERAEQTYEMFWRQKLADQVSAMQPNVARYFLERLSAALSEQAFQVLSTTFMPPAPITVQMDEAQAIAAGLKSPAPPAIPVQPVPDREEVTEKNTPPAKPTKPAKMRTARKASSK